ncbi:hypothetical protein ACG7TL_002142 [Trametes sanguinea]
MVCTDQWMVTHVDPSWPVSQVKRFLLQKFSRESTTVDKTKRSIPVSPRKARRRSLSPITFAAPLRKPRFVAAEQPESTSGDEVEQTEDLEDDAYFEEGEDDADADVNQTLAEAHRYKYDARPSTSSASDTRLLPDDSSEFTQEATAYTLIAFSTTQILEDRFSLEWYGTRPDELLELHSPSRCLVSLPRFSLDEYITPYFAAKVWALRLAGNTLEGTIRSLLVPSDHQAEDEFADASPRSPMVRDKGKKKINLEWKERWAIVHQGVLSLCKERHASTNVSNLPSEVICLKFADVSPRQRTMSSDSHTPFDRNPSDTEGAVPPADMWDVLARRGSRTGLEDMQDEGEDSIWIVIDMLSSAGPRSTFTFPIAPSPPLSPSTGTVVVSTQRSWKTLNSRSSAAATNQHARRAGLGAVGRAMELVMFGNEEDEDDDEDEDELAIQWARRASAMEPSPFDTTARPHSRRPHSRPRSVRHASDPVISSVAMPSPAGEFDSPHPNRLLHDDSEESEMEWDGWLDVTVMNRRRERVQATRTIERTETLETAVPGDLNWGPEWASRLGLGTSSTAASTPDFERENTWRFPHSHHAPLTPDQEKGEIELIEVLPVSSNDLHDASLLPPPILTLEEERRLWRKIDMRLVPIAVTLYLFSNLDRGNIGNAKLEGLITQLDLTGGRYNVALTMFYLSYSLFNVPAKQPGDQEVPAVQMAPRYYTWGIVAALMGLVKTYPQFVGLRLCLGATEAGLSPGIYYLSFGAKEYGSRAVYGAQLFLPSIINGFGFNTAISQLLSVPPYAIATATVVTCSFYSDRLQMRSPFIFAGLLSALIGFSINISDASIGAKYFGMFLVVIGSNLCSPMVISWQSNNVVGHYKRGIGIAMQVMYGNVAGIIVSNVFRVEDAPRYLRGHLAELVLIGVGLVVVPTAALAYAHLNRRRDAAERESTEKEISAEYTVEELRRLADRAPTFSLQKPATASAGISDSDSPAMNSDETRRLWRRVDSRLIPLVTVMYLVAFIDKTNIGNAKIQGLTTQLNLTGNRFNIILANCVFALPANLLLKRLRPSVWLPGITIVWGIITTLQGVVKSYQQLLALRICLGIAEAGLSPGILYYLTLWYPRYMLQYRIGLFWGGAAFAGAFSGLLAYGISFMAGTRGLEGWSWILEGILSIVVGVIAAFLFVDYPQTANFLKPKEKAYLIYRTKYDTLSAGEDPDFDIKYVLDALRDWQVWVGCLIEMSIITPVYGISLFLPSIINGYVRDVNISNVSIGAKYSGTFLIVIGGYAGFPAIPSWLGNNLAGHYKRGTGMAVQAISGQVGGIIASNIYRTQDAPRYTTGHIVELAFIALGLVLVPVVVLVYTRINSRRVEGQEKAFGEGIPEDFRRMGDRAPEFRYTI